MVTYQKSMQIIALLSFLIFIPSLGYAESLSEMARQLDIENLKKMKNSRGEIIGKHLDERCQNDFLCNMPEQIKKTKKG